MHLSLLLMSFRGRQHLAYAGRRCSENAQMHDWTCTMSTVEPWITPASLPEMYVHRLVQILMRCGNSSQLRVNTPGMTVCRNLTPRGPRQRTHPTTPEKEYIANSVSLYGIC